MFELVLGMCVILLVFIAMCTVEKIPGVDKMLEKGVERMTIENTPKRLSSGQVQKDCFSERAS